MPDITHLRISRKDGRRAYAPAVARVLHSTFGIRATPRGWQVTQSGDSVTLTSIDPYVPDATLTRKLTMLGVEINKAERGSMSAYFATAF